MIMAHAPLEGAGVVDVAEDLVEHLAVRPVDEVVQLMDRPCVLDVACRERVERDAHHLLAAFTHVDEAVHHGSLRVEMARELRQLGDRHALIADALDVDRRVEKRENEAQIRGHRVWRARTS